MNASMSDAKRRQTFTAAFKAYNEVEEHRLALEDFDETKVNVKDKIDCTHVVGTRRDDLCRP